MAYNKFKKLEQLSKELGVQYQSKTWLDTSLKTFNSSKKLLEDLQEAQREGLMTEKAKSEYIIVPVIKELRRCNVDKFSTFSGYEFNVDKAQGLVGYCDFMLSANINKLEINAPVFCLVEAKNAEIDKGLAQCGAEMYAAQIFNQREGNPRKVIYGCVTNAFSWCFLKLEGKELLIENNYVPLTFSEPHRVLAVLQWILDVSLENKQ